MKRAETRPLTLFREHLKIFIAVGITDADPETACHKVKSKVPLLN